MRSRGGWRCQTSAAGVRVQDRLLRSSASPNHELLWWHRYSVPRQRGGDPSEAILGPTRLRGGSRDCRSLALLPLGPRSEGHAANGRLVSATPGRRTRCRLASHLARRVRIWHLGQGPRHPLLLRRRPPRQHAPRVTIASEKEKSTPPKDPTGLPTAEQAAHVRLGLLSSGPTSRHCRRRLSVGS